VANQAELPDLPIAARRAEIEAALRSHPVVVIAGDTGSGKSTQLPRYCLSAGRGAERLIAHTQPRRLAARALASRIADEMRQPVGGTVGYRVRFADQVTAATRIVLMTDGLLLAELASDPMLRRYDTVIVDEAHERSLNIDLLLGVLKRLLPKRPDLKVIVTSATLDVERIAQFFDGAPIITISGRSHPIEVRYAPPPEDAEDPDLPRTVLEAYRDIETSPGPGGNGDVLVFLPGEREIRDVGDVLEREVGPHIEVLPLYSRLSWEQQSRIFQRGARRRVVLATNVAETSITVPGIHAVIDSGLARVSRYSPRNRLQRLPIEPVSRAGADQRKGRCGRLGPGLCIRLYSEEDFAARLPFTEPEVLRTNLAALLLRLAADGLGEAESFPFVDPPDSRSLADGYRVLQELEALDADRRITRQGRAMARLPLDPRLARALLESRRFRAEAELLAVVAGLSVPDPRMERADAAGDPVVAGFEDGKSEFAGMVKLWTAYRSMRKGPRRELKRWCKERRLSLLRLSEWEDVHAQVADRAAEAGIKPQSRPASYTALHRSLLAGFCSMVGTRGEDGAYVGTRGMHFHIFPGSSLKRRRPRWVMAASIVETSRVFARRVAEIEPSWIEGAAVHLLKREYLEPDWSEQREEVVARERISLLGLVLRANRTVNYGPIAPEESRMIFAREALVYRRLLRRPAWLCRNDEALLAAHRTEDRLRTRDLVRPAEAFVDFYVRVLPRQVSSAATLDHFTRHLNETTHAALLLGADDIFARHPDPKLLAQFPDHVKLAGSSVGVSVDYRFAPGDADDGATLRIPLLALPTLTREAVDAAVPGLVAPRVEALLRSLPKDVRRALIPMGTTVQSFIGMRSLPEPDLVAPGAGSRAERPAGTDRSAGTERLAQWLTESRGIPAHQVRFAADAVPAHLKARIAVLEPGAASPAVLAQGDDLGAMRRRFAAAVRAELARLSRLEHPAPWTGFGVDRLPEELLVGVNDGSVVVYPTLARLGRDVVVGFEISAAEAARSLRLAAPALARRMLERQARDLARAAAADVSLTMAALSLMSGEALIDGMLQLAFRRACFPDLPPRERAGFETAIERGRARLFEEFDSVVGTVKTLFAAAREVRRLLDDPRVRRFAPLVEESRAHLESLFQPERLFGNAGEWMRQLPRYLKAEERRWQRVLSRGGEASQIQQELTDWTQRRGRLWAEVGAERRWLPELEEFDLWLEEYRISVYAQELRTLGPVSAARLAARASEIDQWLKR
jgi:ATP-dependent helicase HrpA